MKRKLVYRYYCEFCKKANCCASAMTKHERGCTANQNRECGMCKATEHAQADLADIIDALEHDVEATKGEDLYDGSIIVCTIKNVEPRLAWIVADFCPACLLAAIRQIKRRDAVQFQWDFMEAKKAFWQSFNEQTAGVH